MKASGLYKILLVAFSCLLSSNSATAALIQYTYSSQPLDWHKTIIGGTLWDEEIIHEDDGKISFQFSFSLDDALISASAPTKIFVTNAQLLTDIVYDYDWWTPEFVTESNAKVIINPDGTINAWSLVFKTYIDDLRDPEFIREMTDHRLYVNSQGGKSTCNCDYFQEKRNFVIQRPEDSWIIASSGDSTYKSDNSLSQWTIQKISVPEPTGLLLATMCLLGLTLRRMLAK